MMLWGGVVVKGGGVSLIAHPPEEEMLHARNAGGVCVGKGRVSDHTPS